jgi:hypothetical protein
MHNVSLFAHPVPPPVTMAIISLRSNRDVADSGRFAIVRKEGKEARWMKVTGHDDRTPPVDRSETNIRNSAI